MLVAGFEAEDAAGREEASDPPTAVHCHPADPHRSELDHVEFARGIALHLDRCVGMCRSGVLRRSAKPSRERLGKGGAGAEGRSGMLG